MQNRDFERVLMAVWLQGRYLEYLDSFEEPDFMLYPHVFSALKKAEGKADMLSIGKLCGESVIDLAELVSGYGWHPEWFPGAFKLMRAHSLDRIAKEFAANPYDAVEFAQRIESISNITVAAAESIDLSSGYLAFLDRRNVMKKLLYGFPEIDDITGGGHPGELTVIAARPSIGKSALALNIALNASFSGHNVLFFSLEMTANQITERIICRYSDVQAAKLKMPKSLTDEDWEAVERTLNHQIPKTLNVVDGAHSIDSIRHLVNEKQPDIVIIDQLSHIKTRDFKTIRDRFVYLTNSIKSMAIEYDIPVILLAQINRSGQDRIPTLADLKESGSIEEDSDNIYIIHRPSKDEVENSPKLSKLFNYNALEQNGRSPIILSLAKHRNGETRNFPMVYHGRKFVFEEVAYEK